MMVNETLTEEVAPRNTVEVEGVIIDTDTGEIVETARPFVVEDEESLEWFLKRVATIDARIKALAENGTVQAARATMAREDVTQAQAVLANLGAMQARLQAARDGLLRWQDAPLRATASALLAEKHEKGRTLRTLFGAVSLKKIAARWKVDAGVETKLVNAPDGMSAWPPLLKWASDAYPETIKETYEFQISRLPKDADRPEEFFTLEPERETVSIDTGVGLRVESN
jgi:hypothetical protein